MQLVLRESKDALILCFTLCYYFGGRRSTLYFFSLYIDAVLSLDTNLEVFREMAMLKTSGYFFGSQMMDPKSMSNILRNIFENIHEGDLMEWIPGMGQ